MRYGKTTFTALFTLLLMSSGEFLWAQSGRFPSYQASTQPRQEESAEPSKQAPNRFPQGDSSASKPSSAFPTDDASSSSKGTSSSFTSNNLAELLRNMGLSPAPNGNGQDVLYNADLNDQEVQVSFSLKISADRTQLRVRAWLDPLPEGKISAPHLLELLSANAEMESCLHFAYSKAMQRFLLEKVVSTEDLTSAELDSALLQVSDTVANTWLLWSTSEWTTGSPHPPVEAELDQKSQELNGKFEMPIIR